MAGNTSRDGLSGLDNPTGDPCLLMCMPVRGTMCAHIIHQVASSLPPLPVGVAANKSLLEACQAVALARFLGVVVMEKESPSKENRECIWWEQRTGYATCVGYQQEQACKIPYKRHQQVTQAAGSQVI